jgi:hypothetical protein
VGRIISILAYSGRKLQVLGRHSHIPADLGQRSRHPAQAGSSPSGWAGLCFIPAGPSQPPCGSSARPSRPLSRADVVGPPWRLSPPLGRPGFSSLQLGSGWAYWPDTAGRQATPPAELGHARSTRSPLFAGPCLACAPRLGRGEQALLVLSGGGIGVGRNRASLPGFCYTKSPSQVPRVI